MPVELKKSRHFLVQMESFRNEATLAAQYIYADMAIEQTASESNKLLNRLNRTPNFWLAVSAALQTSGFVALGRIFDKTSAYNVERLLDAFEVDLHLFQRDALAERKREGRSDDPPWLEEYLAEAYYPTGKDIVVLRAKVNNYRDVFERVIKPARNKYFAHREKHGKEDIAELFAGAKVKDLWNLVTFLLQLEETLTQMYLNGRKPTFRRIRYSPRAMLKSKEVDRGSAHEMIVQQVKQVMAMIDTPS